MRKRADYGIWKFGRENAVAAVPVKRNEGSVNGSFSEKRELWIKI